jgi:hypothetical protein
MKLLVLEHNMREQGKESFAEFVHSNLHFACKKNKKQNNNSGDGGGDDAHGGGGDGDGDVYCQTQHVKY